MIGTRYLWNKIRIFESNCLNKQLTNQIREKENFFSCGRTPTNKYGKNDRSKKGPFCIHHRIIADPDKKLLIHANTSG